MNDFFNKWAKTIWIVILMASIGSFAVYFSSKYSHPNAFCDPAPYIYATFHHEAPNIYKYSRNGCLLSKTVLQGGPEYALTSHLIELRSIVFGNYNNTPVLYVADAYSDDSYLNVYGSCDKNGERPFITTAVSTFTDPGINHPYGIAFDPENNLLVSSQHTDNVLRFKKDTFEPMAFPSKMMRSVAHTYDYYPGTFLQFGEPNVHDVDHQGVRDVISVEDKIWVANEDIDSIYVVDAATGRVEDIIEVDTPIGLHYNRALGLVFVSSKGPKNMGFVHSIDVHSKAFVMEYQSKKMTHPTGMITHHTTLYVANQKRGQIVSFNIRSGRFLKIIVDDMPAGIEKILLSDC
jgi:YVTN family beta-propeller protein